MRDRSAKTDQWSWDDLRTVLFLSRAGSVRRAARALDVSHSTVLRRLAALEAAAGLRLFDRKAQGYEVTASGQDVIDSAAEIEEVVLALERRAAGRDLRLAGAVRVTLPDPFLPLLAPAFHALARAHPGIDTTVAVGTDYLDLAHRDADVAIRIAHDPPPELVGHRVCTAAVGVYGATKYLARRPTADLGALDWVGWQVGSSMGFAAWMRREVPDARVALRVSAGWALRDAVDAGCGVALLPCALGDAQRAWHRLRVVPEAAAPLWILTHKDLKTTARVRVVRDFLADALRAERALIEGRSAAARSPRRRSTASDRSSA